MLLLNFNILSYHTIFDFISIPYMDTIIFFFIHDFLRLLFPSHLSDFYLQF